MRYILVLLGLLVTSKALAIDCQAVPDCKELGYSQENNPDCQENGYIYCPFDTSYKKCVNYKCEALGFTKEDKSSWCNKLIKCKGDTSYTLCQNLCEIGDVYYADGTCGYVQDYDPNDKAKTPVGVVFYVTDEGRHGKVVALQNAQAAVAHHYFDHSPTSSFHEIMPIGYLNYDNLKSYNWSIGITPAYKDRESDFFDGKENTAKMLQGEPVEKTKCEEGKYQKDTEAWEVYCQATAALKCLEFAPSDNPKTGKGNWYLPALGEWMDLYGYDTSKLPIKADEKSPYVSAATGATKAIVSKTFNALKQKGVTAGWFQSWMWSWTSTKCDSLFCTLNIGSGGISSDGIYKEGYVQGVRPMLQF